MMTTVPSTMIPLGIKAPDFNLLDTRTGKLLSLEALKSDKCTVIMFICNHCPYVQYILAKLVEVARLYQTKGVSFIAISSNDAQDYPADGPEAMQQQATAKNFTFPYLYDETQEVGKAYQAACTPDFYIYDKNLKCVYRGRFDDATPGNGVAVTGSDLIHALDETLAGQPVSAQQKPSLGCNIKYRK